MIGACSLLMVVAQLSCGLNIGHLSCQLSHHVWRVRRSRLLTSIRKGAVSGHFTRQINRTFQKLNTDTRLPSGGKIKQIKHMSLVLMAFASWLLDAMHMKWLIIYMKSDVRLWSHYGCMPHQRRVCSCNADRQCWGKYVKAWWRTLVFNDFLLHSTTKCNIWYSVCMKAI